MQLAAELEPRGVYYYRHTIDGCRALYAVKRNGDRLRIRGRVKTIVLKPGISEEHAVAWLWQMLERLDPEPPPLTLVKHAAPDALPGPQLIEDRIRYALRLAREAGRRMPHFR